MSAVLFGHKLTINFIIGVTIVFISMHQFFSQGKPGVLLDSEFGLSLLSWDSISGKTGVEKHRLGTF